LTLGVLGHVDHGKTALVRALTGTDTDRLDEERTRGLSIVLGFAHLETDAGVVDVIDVPGHEDFVRAMISGATGLDAVALVVAANEGVMPQTREHFDIARLLGVSKGFVVLTKCDLVEPERLATVRDELRGFTAQSFLEGAPLIETALVPRAAPENESASPGEEPGQRGIAGVRSLLGTFAAAAEDRAAGPQFFLPLDRVFTLRGHGVVGTGTLRAGAVTVDERVEILPARREASVRALQIHNRPVDRALPGRRVAVNLRGVRRDDVRRGDLLATPGFLAPTRRLDVELSLLASARAPLANGAVVRLLVGTTEAIARLRLLDRRELAPGATGFVQLRLDRDIATHRTERFIVRTYSPMRTIGGGRILDASPERHRRFDAGVMEGLATAASGNLEKIVAGRLGRAGLVGLERRSLASGLDLTPDGLTDALERIDALEIGADRVVDGARCRAFLVELVEVVRAYHETNPLHAGAPLSSLATRVRELPGTEVLRYAVDRLVVAGDLARVGEALSLPDFDPFATLALPQRRVLVAIEEAFRRARFEAPALAEVIGADTIKRALFRLLLEAGRLVQLRTYDRGSDRVLHAETVAEARRLIEARFPPPREFAVKDVRDVLASTRKHVVPLLEHFDATGVTVRNGDLRRLRPDPITESSQTQA
jgi:selenocysteine-specific elongation factor